MRLTCILIAWIAGIAQIGVSESTTVFIYLLFFVLCMLGLELALWLKWFKFNHYCRALILLLSIWAIFLFGQAYANRYLSQQLQYRETQASTATVLIFVDHIAEKTQQESNKWQQRVWVLDRQPQAVRWRMRYPVHSQTQLQLGHYYRVTGRIVPHQGYAVAHVFNQELWLLQQQYKASFEVELLQTVTAEEVKKHYGQFVEQQQQPLVRLLQQIESKRWYFRQWLQQRQLTQQGLILALVTADQSLLPESMPPLFRRLGIMHLLAISGPHVLIFALLCSALVKVLIGWCYPSLLLYWPRPDLLLWPFVICVWWYAAFIGFEIPALRTVLTVSLLSLLLLAKQRFSTLHLLLLSASILLFFDPLNILATAFWLSYISSLILIRIYLGQRLHSQWEMSRAKRIAVQMLLLVQAQWKIFIALLPLMLWVFQQFSWLAPLANIIAIPILGLIIVPLAVLASRIFTIFPDIASRMLQLVNVFLESLLWLLQRLDQVINAVMTPALTSMQIVGLSLVLLLLFLPGILLLRIYWLCCGVACIYIPQLKTAFELTLIDVGQGQALFVKLAKKHLMIDVGGSYQEAQWGIGEHVLSPFLLAQGIDRLDQVVISHLDQDHRGGLSTLSKQIKIKSFLSSQFDQGFAQAGYADVPFQYCYQGQHWQYEGVRIEILAPRRAQLADAEQHKNERSCIVYIQVEDVLGYRNFLIMGDAGWPTEYQLMQDYPDLEVDVLVIGHHGSRHSSAYDFLKWLKPKLAVVSVGKNNRYGHPHPKVLARLQALSIPLKQTQDEGSLRFYVDQQQTMQLEQQRDQQRWLR